MNRHNNSRRLGFLMACCLIATMPLTGQMIRVTGTLSDADGRPVAGLIHAIEVGPGFSIDNVMADEDGRFSLSVRTRYGALIRVSSEDHPPEEHYIEPGSAGDVRLDFSFLRAQDLTGRIVNEYGIGIAAATVHVRYHEPGMPYRRSAFHDLHETGPDGTYSVRNVGIEVPFRIDVHAPGYVPVSSEKLERKLGDVRIPEITLTEKGGTVGVRVVDKAGVPVDGADVTVLADPAGYEAHEHGSLIHARGFSQVSATLRSGEAWFSGVPAGRIRILAKSARGEAEVEKRIGEGQRLEINLSIGYSQ